MIKDGEEWKDPQPWRSFDRDGRGRTPDRATLGRGDARSPRGRKVVRGQIADGTRIRDARVANETRTPHPRARAESESLDDFADWWGATGGDDARRGVRDAKVKDAARWSRERGGDASGETRRAHPEPDDEMKTKPKPRQTQEAERGAGDRDAASSSSSLITSKLSADSKAFEPTPPTPPVDQADPLDEWSALDEELEKALASTEGNRGSGARGRRR